MSIESIAVFTDFSENAEIAFNQAFDMARKYAAKLRVVHVVPPVLDGLITSGASGMIPLEFRDEVMTDIEERLALLCSENDNKGVDLSYEIIGGHVSTEILDYIDREKIDLAVLGAFGMSGVGLVLFGSVAKRVAHRARCSVMIVRDRIKSKNDQKQ